MILASSTVLRAAAGRCPAPVGPNCDTCARHVAYLIDLAAGIEFSHQSGPPFLMSPKCLGTLFYIPL